MMIVSLSSLTNLQKKINSILDTAESKNENAVVVLVSGTDYNNLKDFMSSHKAIDVLKTGNEVFFIIKHMRIEIKKIDYYI